MDFINYNVFVPVLNSVVSITVTEHLEREDLYLCELVNKVPMRELGYPLSGEEFSLEETVKAWSKLSQSPLAMSGVLQVAHGQKGVQRNPLDEFSSATWDTDVKRL